MHYICLSSMLRHFQLGIMLTNNRTNSPHRGTFQVLRNDKNPRNLPMRPISNSMLPPMPHCRVKKQYEKTSPVRSKEKLLEARFAGRKYSRKPSARNKSKGTTHEELICKLSSLFKREKENSTNLVKRCQETYVKQIRALTDEFHHQDFFSVADKREACSDYIAVQKKIKVISRGKCIGNTKIRMKGLLT